MTETLAGPTSHSFISQRLRLHYVDWGNPDAPPVVLVHGGQDHCRNWDWVAQDLRRDYHVIAYDLRGHGDSDHSSSGDYALATHIYDLGQLIHQQRLAPVRIVAHSLGGNIALRYTGLYPETVSKLVAIEGLGPTAERLQARGVPETMAARLRSWLEGRRVLAGRLPRRYPTIEEACARMQKENRHLSPEQARHLTIHGASQNEDGTYSWKFDQYVRSWSPIDIPDEALHAIWGAISCPTLLVNGRESWASNPETDGRLQYFKTARVAMFDNAGHWVHHDRLEAFLAEVRAFL